MSTVVRPSGRLPARVYWVRRLLLLAIVLGLVWGVVRLVGGSDPASGEPSPSDSSSEAAADATASSQAPEAEQTRRAPTPREIRERRIRARQARQAELGRLQQVQDVTPALSSPAGPCDLTQVHVDAQLPEPAYAGTAVPMRIELRTQQVAACTLDLTADRLLMSVVAGEATVWTTSRCPDAIPRRTVVLRPSWTSTVDVEWSARTSGRRCSIAEDFAAPGDYELRLAALTGEPASVPFTLEDRTAVAPPGADNEPERDAEADGGEPAPDEGAGEASPDSPDGGEPSSDGGAGEASPDSPDGGYAGAGPNGGAAGGDGAGGDGAGDRGDAAGDNGRGDGAGGSGEAGGQRTGE